MLAIDVFWNPSVLLRLDAPELAKLSCLTSAPNGHTDLLEAAWAKLQQRDLLFASRDATAGAVGTSRARRAMRSQRLSTSQQVWGWISNIRSAPSREITLTEVSSPVSASSGRYADAMRDPCSMCRQHLYSMRRTGRHHCTCIANRGARLPLTVASLRGRQSGPDTPDGLETFHIWREARQLLGQHFDLRFAEASALTADLLQGADLLLLDLVSSITPLQPLELEVLQEFVKKGGYAVLSAFSNWSVSDFHQSCVGWLGISPVPHSTFRRRIAASLQTSSRVDVCELLDGPFGEARVFVNVGETDHELLPLAEELEVHSLTPRLHLYSIGLGQVLVHSNWHWITDPMGWNGGTVRDNEVLLLNLAAAACRKLLEKL